MILRKEEDMKEKIRNFLGKYKLWLIFITGLGIFLDVFFLSFSSDLLILILTALWVLAVWLYKFDGRISVGIALGFLIICPILLVFKKEPIAEKAAIWVYMFLAIGVIQLFVENV